MHADVIALKAFVRSLGYSRYNLPEVPMPEEGVPWKQKSWKAKEAHLTRAKWASLLEAAARMLFDIKFTDPMPDHLHDFIGYEYRPDQEIPRATWRDWLGCLDPITNAPQGYGHQLVEDMRMAIFTTPAFRDELEAAGLTQKALARRLAGLFDEMTTDMGKLEAIKIQGGVLSIDLDPAPSGGDGRSSWLDEPYTPPALMDRPAEVEDAEFEDVEHDD